MTADLFALLTRIRVSRSPTDLAKAARQQHYFVLVGLVVGLLATLTAMVLVELSDKGEEMVFAGVLMVVLYYITGILHTEGLADFADGVMAGGTQERKREAMKDVHIGVAGVFTVVMFMIMMFVLISRLLDSGGARIEPFPLPWEIPILLGFVLAEVSGKLAMNVSMYLGPSAHPGMGSLFVQSASAKKMVATVLIASGVGVLIAGWLVVVLVFGLLAGLMVTMIARKNFGGVSGDTFGAANEVGRIVTLFAWVLLV
jgi:adenosylcobinamide-GDP ribazoletransferase